MIRFYFLLGFFALLNTTLVFATGVRGIIKADNGEPLPFATIYIKELGTGTTSNAQGFYEIALPEGTYTLSYQFWVMKVSKR